MCYIGIISGTSVDAVDIALVDFANQTKLIAYHQYPIPKELQDKIHRISPKTTLVEIMCLDHQLGELFAHLALSLVDEHAKDYTIKAIGSHGQTIYHQSHNNILTTKQIGDPNIIAYQTEINTVADFRRMDIAAGGQGAPLITSYHQWQFHSSEVTRIVLNIGGIANITVLPKSPDQAVVGYDTGVGNTLIDAWVRQHRQQKFDQDGQWARQGQYHKELLNVLMDDPYHHTAPPKSTGRDYFNLNWLTQKITAINTPINEQDIAATLIEYTARTISQAILEQQGDEVLVCGGGVHNSYLMQRIEALLTEQTVHSTAHYNIPPDAVEAIAFAWLAKKRMEQTAANMPSVTGAKKPVILGALYQAKATESSGILS